MSKSRRLQVFEACITPHLDAGYNLARWLCGHAQDAEDILQDAGLRALKYFDSFSGENCRAWFLKIVRNTAYSWLAQKSPLQNSIEYQDELLSDANEQITPDSVLIQFENASLLQRSMAELPLEFREVLVLRELEGMAYKEMAVLLEIPIGTVMSRLARGRQHLLTQLTKNKEGHDEL